LKTAKSKYLKAKSQLRTINCGFASIQVLLITFCFAFLLSSCRDENPDNLTILSPVAVYDVNIKETSDLCFGATKDILYTVSDNTAKPYKISTTGKVLSVLNYTGFDLEGITYVDNKFLYVAEERLRVIVKLDLQGNKIEQKAIPVEKNDENQGLEGISYATFNNHFYILNEMNPGLLIETDQNLNVLKNYTLKFAEDYSGVCVDNVNQQLWIVSDLSATVNQCTMQGELIKSYRIPVSNAEGIAFDPKTNKLYIISDSEARLYFFQINN